MTRAKELTCREVSEFLAGYLAGELRPDERILFDEHLAECPACVAYLQRYTETIRLAKDAYAADEAPADAPDELIQAILTARKQRSPPR